MNIEFCPDGCLFKRNGPCPDVCIHHEDSLVDPFEVSVPFDSKTNRRALVVGEQDQYWYVVDHINEDLAQVHKQNKRLKFL